MNRICQFCQKSFELTSKNSWNKLFCNVTCQQEYWKKKRSKGFPSNKSQRQEGEKIRKTIHLTNYQLQVVYGSLLGDSSLRQYTNGTCGVKMCHTEKQLDYLEFKKRILMPFFLQKHPNVFGPYDKSFSTNPSYSYSSIVHQDFTNLFGLFYRTDKGQRKKYICPTILNKLEPMAILIWFLDDGCYCYNKERNCHQMTLSTYRYSIAEHQTLKKWFWHKWRIEAKLCFHRPSNSFIMRFGKNDMITFNNLFLKPFKHLVPSCMHYKFPEF